MKKIIRSLVCLCAIAFNLVPCVVAHADPPSASAAELKDAAAKAPTTANLQKATQGAPSPERSTMCPWPTQRRA